MSTKVNHPLDEKTIETVKATVPVLAEHGEAITKHFYHIMFQDHPELKNIFNQTHQQAGDQPRALANMVYAAAKHMDDLSAIIPKVKQIAEKHRSLNVQPKHYPIVGEYLLIAIKEVLGDAATDDIIEAWRQAYGVIAQAFIDIEGHMYQAAEAQKGGWVGYRNFTVIHKVKESEVITSFYLKPVDGGALPFFKPGQYLTIKAEIPGQTYDHLRQYSLSDVPGKDYFRISVKRESGRGDHEDGIVSTWLHDQVEKGDHLPISAPAGDFHIDEQLERPLVLISGGVGLTPLMSMWKYAQQAQPGREVHFIHAAKNGNHHALKQEMNAAAPCTAHIIYETPTEADHKEGSYDQQGFIDLDWLKHIVPHQAEFYFCGPEEFMKAVYRSLLDWKVSRDRIHYEFFGPQGNWQVD